MNKVVKNGIYKHFKGNYYLLEDTAVNSEDGSEYVVYRALYEDTKLYIRPLDMFLSKVDKSKYPECKQTYRFEFQNITSINKS